LIAKRALCKTKPAPPHHSREEGNFTRKNFGYIHKLDVGRNGKLDETLIFGKNFGIRRKGRHYILWFLSKTNHDIVKILMIFYIDISLTKR